MKEYKVDVEFQITKVQTFYIVAKDEEAADMEAHCSVNRIYPDAEFVEVKDIEEVV